MTEYISKQKNSCPNLCDEIIFENDQFELRRKWTWDTNGIWPCSGDNLLRVKLNNGLETIIPSSGIKKEQHHNFLDVDTPKNGLIRVQSVSDEKYGFLNESLQIKIPMVYDKARDFCNNKSIVQKGNDVFILDTDGNEILLANDQGTCPYEVIENFNHGLAAVSTSKTRLFWGCDYYAGCWGFIDESGEEVITPKYYAVEQYHAFADNYATVCKTGTDNEGKTIYRWGLIDISGNETVPCKYAHIIRLFNYTWEMNSGLFAAAIIRDKEWLWGIIDGQGKQVVPFIFEDDFWNQYTIKDNLLIYTSDTHSDGYNQESHGLYDIKTQTILIEPGIYRDMDFDDFGNIQAEDYKGITHILDSQTCKEIFPSEYSFFSASEKTGHYIVSCRKNGQRHEGLIDKTGTVIISPTKDITEILCNQNWIKFRKDGKVGVRDFDGNTVIPPLYDEIRSTYNPLIEICNKPNENKNLYGLAARNGICVLEPTYDSICWMADKKHFMLAKEHHYEMIEYREKKSV